eukprot:TRINITY_DN739_c0_g1_i1.p1 TRINITY_DN739_c0_g1~~TRINITY_DN739_c0_g1_i1.p1  ORF type:complete len:611 (-),score=101.43 TRINITY_DN739_c0_g1_i1:2-1834(-)
MSLSPYCSRKDAFSTICVHGGYDPDSTTSCAPPLYRTSSYVFKDTTHASNLFALADLGYIYTRIGNPTQAALEERMAMLEGGAGALALSSGTSSIFYSIINLASRGDNIISSAALYGGTYTMFSSILPTYGIKVKFCDSEDLKAMESLVDERTRAIFVETLTNPSLVVTDLAACAQIAHRHGLPLLVDATFSTPYLCNPIKFGADIVIHSLTKWIGGHGTGIGGIIVDGGNFNWCGGRHPLFDEPDMSYKGIRWGHDLPSNLKPLAFLLRARTVPLRNLGACISPDNAWMFLNGLETLHVRMKRHCENALALASYLRSHPCIQWARYPGMPENKYYPLCQKYLNGQGGSLVVFEIKGGRVAGEKFINSVRIIRHLANVGDTKTLAVHPASTTHSQMDEKAQKEAGITPGMVRLAVGIENVFDLMKDIDQALCLATSPESEETKEVTKETKEVTFEPGPWGLAFSGNTIEEVVVDSQAANAGVRKGWSIMAINGERQPADQSAIDQAIQKSHGSTSVISFQFQKKKHNLQHHPQHKEKVRPYCNSSDSLETICIHGGYDPDETGSCAVPIHRTSSYVFKNTEHAANLFALKDLGNIYTHGRSSETAKAHRG